MTVRPSLALLTLLLASTASAHRFHVSLAEAEFDARRGSIEVALRVDDHDLEDALRLRLGRRHRFRNDAAGERECRDYVKAHFMVSPSEGPALELEWVGWDWAAGTAWLYFEFQVEGDPSGLQLTNTLFLELSSKQVNTVNVRSGKERHSLTFLGRSTQQSLGLTRQDQGLAEGP